MNRQPGLFDRAPRAQPRVIAHMADAGAEAARFECNCGWDSGWIVGQWTDTEIRRGIPCERCNMPPREEAAAEAYGGVTQGG